MTFATLSKFCACLSLLSSNCVILCAQTSYDLNWRQPASLMFFKVVSHVSIWCAAPSSLHSIQHQKHYLYHLEFYKLKAVLTAKHLCLAWTPEIVPCFFKLSSRHVRCRGWEGWHDISESSTVWGTPRSAYLQAPFSPKVSTSTWTLHACKMSISHDDRTYGGLKIHSLKSPNYRAQKHNEKGLQVSSLPIQLCLSGCLSSTQADKRQG